MFQRLGLLLVGLFTALLAVEILFRLTAFKAGAELASDRPKRYYFQESSYSARDYHYARQKPEGVFRIIALGDSFTFGAGLQIDDSYPKRLERLLNLNISQPKVEVLNFGTPGYSTRNEASFLSNGFGYSPDLVILQITLNDPEIKQYVPAEMHSINSKGAAVVKGGIYDYWKSLGFVVSRIKNTASHQTFLKYYKDLYRSNETLSNFRGALSEIKKSCTARSVKLVAVIFPLFDFPLDQNYPFFDEHKIISELLQTQETLILIFLIVIEVWITLDCRSNHAATLILTRLQSALPQNRSIDG